VGKYRDISKIVVFGTFTTSFPDWKKTPLMNKPIPFNEYFFIEKLYIRPS
jgi:hypothetical protein